MVKVIEHRVIAGALILLLAGAAGVAAADTPYIRGVPYFRQFDNEINPGGSCQITCMAMVLAYFGAEEVTPDALSGRWGTGPAETTSGWREIFNTEAVERGLFVRDQGELEGRLSHVHELLRDRIPVVVHGSFSASGHLIVLLGYDGDYYYAHDPGGDWTFYGATGRHVRYPREAVERAIVEPTRDWVRYHALELVPSPVQANWHGAWPDSVVMGAQFEAELGVDVEADGSEDDGRVTVDLGELGGPPAAELKRAGPGQYRLAASFRVSAAVHGLKQVKVRIEKVEGLGDRGLVLTRTIAVLPQKHEVVYAEGGGPGWEGGENDLITGLDEVHAGHVFSGETAIEVEAEGFLLDFQAPQPVPPHGYGVLRLAIHPGDAVRGDEGLFAAFVNRDPRTGVQLLDSGEAGMTIDLDRKEWQVVEIPVRLFSWTEEPIESVQLYGGLRGTFYVDDLGLVPARPNPIVAAWAAPLPDSLVAGRPLVLNLEVAIAALAMGGGEPRVTADLRELGGSAQAELVAADDGVFGLLEDLDVAVPNGLATVRVRIAQQAGTITHVRELTTQITVVPNRDEVVVGDGLGANWAVASAFKAELDATAGEMVYEGESALAVQADYFIIDLGAAVPVDPIGYRALQLAFHPATATARSKGAFSVFVNEDSRTAVKLLDGASEGMALDMDRDQWQVVEIPMSAFGEFAGPIASIRFSGNLSGTFYLDAVRLLPDQVSPPVETAVLGDLPVIPQEPSLAQSYPNPFNSQTSISFALRQSQDVEVVMYDVVGQQIRMLAAGSYPAGNHLIQWNGRDDAGRPVASGVYLYCLRTGTRELARKLILAR